MENVQKKEIDRLGKEFKEKGSDVVIGIGGGKIHDTSKLYPIMRKLL